MVVVVVPVVLVVVVVVAVDMFTWSLVQELYSSPSGLSDCLYGSKFCCHWSPVDFQFVFVKSMQ